jgi:hypothetical protein
MPNSANKVGLAVYKNYYVFFINSCIFTYQLDCFNQYVPVSTKLLGSNILDIQIRYPYIIYNMNSTLYQVDIDVGY